MTGSKRWFQYEDDAGLKYAVELDESNGEVEALGFGQVDISETIAEGRMLTVGSSRPLSMRYVNVSRVSAASETIRRAFYVGNPVAFNDLKSATSVSVGGFTWSISSLRGETTQLVPARDTAQLDGDDEIQVVA